MMRISADKDKCLGTGNCALVAPDVFDQDDDDGTVTLLRTGPPKGRLEAVRRAVLLCPSGAIRFTEETLVTSQEQPVPLPGAEP